jgi:hypothetical protein
MSISPGKKGFDYEGKKHRFSPETAGFLSVSDVAAGASMSAKMK